MKSDNPKISVIVPVYNAEKYLRRCINSILNQTFTDFEVLLINDGSTDSSGVICDEYAKQDSRIRVFHKENGGVSSARNVGLQNMKGEYSIHCDSDDYVDISMYELLYAKAKEGDLDITWCDFFRVNEKGSQTVLSQEYIEDPKECIKGLLIGKIHGSTWNKLIKNSLIKNNNISFPRGINMAEDLCFVINVLLFSTKVGYIKSALYYYEYNENSICSLSLKNKVFYDWIKVVSYIEELFYDNGVSFEELNFFKIRAKSSLLYSIEVFNPSLWRRIYSDVNKIGLLTNSLFPTKYKIVHILAFCRMDVALWIVANIYKKIV